MTLLDEYTECLLLERTGDAQFIGKSLFSPNVRQIFGGQVLGQSISAATQTVSDRYCHALSCHFLRGGQMDLPLYFDVENVRDGKSFSVRRVTASQEGKPILSLEASFQVDCEGLEHQPVMPPVEGPESLPDYASYKQEFEAADRKKLYRFLVEQSVFEFRCCEKPGYIET